MLIPRRLSTSRSRARTTDGEPGVGLRGGRRRQRPGRTGPREVDMEGVVRVCRAEAGTRLLALVQAEREKAPREAIPGMLRREVLEASAEARRTLRRTNTSGRRSRSSWIGTGTIRKSESYVPSRRGWCLARDETDQGFSFSGWGRRPQSLCSVRGSWTRPGGGDEQEGCSQSHGSTGSIRTSPLSFARGPGACALTLCLWLVLSERRQRHVGEEPDAHVWSWLARSGRHGL